MWVFLCFLLVASLGQAAGRRICFGDCDCLDIAFIIDTSRSINDAEWNELQDFLCRFVTDYDAKSVDISYAAVSFSIEANLDFNLGELSSVAEVKAALMGIQRARRKTRHDAGLIVVRDQVFTDAGGDRDDARCPDVAIMITDGFNNTGGDAASVARDLMDNGVTVVSVGVGNNRVQDFLVEISSRDDDNNPLEVGVQEFDQLMTVLEDLETMTCIRPCPAGSHSQEGDPQCQTCCCGRLSDPNQNFPDSDFNCCGTQVYDFREATCCEGVLSPVPESEARCCGTQAFNPGTHACCAGVVSEARPVQTQCCVAQPYFVVEQLCCGDGVNARLTPRTNQPNFTECCGDTAYNLETHTCCVDQLFEGPQSSTRCCGDVIYHPTEQNCCDPDTSTLQDSPIPLTGVRDFLPCGDEKYDPAWNTCCCDVVRDGPVDEFTGCCGTVRYDLRTHICCGDTLSEADPDVFQCCDDNVYNPSEDTCCAGQVFSGVGDCCGTTGIFHPEVEICCDLVQVHRGPQDTTKCCFHEDGTSQPFDVNTQVCCDGVVQPGGPFFRCCGQTSFETLWFSCCDHRIVDRSIFRNTNKCS